MRNTENSKKGRTVTMFGSKKSGAEEKPPVIHIHQPPMQIVQDIEYRPCWVRGRKALFHRWANDARPQLPHGQEPGENARYYQFRSTKALVEFEDGTVEAVWPQYVKFADGGRFRDYAWEPVEKEGVND